MHKNPYADDLGSRNPLETLADTPLKIAMLVRTWPTARWDHSYAPGKWSGRRLIVHLAQTELALTTRVRFAASQDGYVAQAFNQDDWLALDDHVDGSIALDAYLALRRLNVAMFRGMSPQQRQRPFTHPEYGELTPDWVAAQLAGHDIHHLRQLERIP